MGKDQEFLDAARNGNIGLIEKVLIQRTKRAGPLASLRRGPGVNVQDSGGYSALHHACINGHDDIVRLLLAHEASPNLPDSRGSSPLHLAAWAGHAEIVELLLTHPYRPANPNLLTIENETPLHCAAQHGHTDALAVLLAHDADPNMQNTRGETPLDLAAQYGRLQAVQMLIRSHPELIAPFSDAVLEGHGNHQQQQQPQQKQQQSQKQNRKPQKSRHSSPLPHSGSVSTPSPSSPSINSSPPTPSRLLFPHTCLHLASRNGHKQVVETLLSAGVSVNLLTPSGSALHEAALCGKESVVRTLLKANIDLNATDAEGRTALDILKEFPPHVTKHIVAVINNFRNQMDTDDSEEVIYRHSIQPQNQQRNSNSTSGATRQQKQQHNNHYHFNSNNHLLNHSHSMQQSAYGNKRNVGSFSQGGGTGAGKSLDSGLQPDEYYGNNRPYYDMNSPVHSHSNTSQNEIGISPSSSMSSFEPASVSPRSRSSAGFNMNACSMSTFNPGAPPKKPPRRNLSVSPTHIGQQFTYTSPNHMQPGQMNLQRRQQQLRSPSNDSPYSHQSHGSVGGISFDETQLRERQRSDRVFASARESTRSATGITMSSSNDMLEKRMEYDESLEPNESTNSMKRPMPSARSIAAISKDIINCENPILKSYNPNRKLKRNRNSYSLNVTDKERRSMSSDSNSDPKSQVPRSPTNYQQPPTPDHPPPSSRQAERTIHERIRPLSQEYKRRSAILQQKHLMIDSSTSPPKHLSNYAAAPPPPPTYADNFVESETIDAPPLPPLTYTRGSLGSLSSNGSYSDESDCVEEFIGDEPFAGLFKGSTMNVINTNKSRQQQIVATQQQRIRPPLPTKPAVPERKFLKTTNTTNVNIKPLAGNIKDETQGIDKSADSKNTQEKQKPVQIDNVSHQSYNSFNNNNGNLNGTANGNNHKEESNNDNEDAMIALDSVGGTDSVSVSAVGINILGDANAQEAASILSPFNAEEARKKISEIIESFGSGILNSNISPANEVELDFDDLEVTAERRELALNLRSAGLLHLERMLFENGYDNYKFVNGVFEDGDVELMHIPEVDSKKLIKFVKTLPQAQFQPQATNKTLTKQTQQENRPTNGCDKGFPPSKGISTLYEWLHSISLPEYTESFNKHLYNTIESVSGVWDVELQTVLEINKVGHRRRILQSLAYMKNPFESKPVKTPLSENTETNKMQKSNGKESNNMPVATTTTGQGGQRSSIVGYRKSRPAPPPPSVTATKATTTTTIKQQQSDSEMDKSTTTITALPSEEPLHIRAPCELLLDLPNDLRTKWRHSANALLNDQIKYEVYYLGSTVVKELRGTESTRKSIEKLRRLVEAHNNTNTSSTGNFDHRNKLSRNSSFNRHRRTIICLAISYRGVEFIDMNSMRTICEHEIQNINCACQDSGDLKHFAYITKENDVHYCHVFSTEHTDQATEIILTLGQAFEVAYQIALRDGVTTTTTINATTATTTATTTPMPIEATIKGTDNNVKIASNGTTIKAQ